jgi:threonylcarbamoyladenosine tRNA methylthiotransferase MtaB
MPTPMPDAPAMGDLRVAFKTLGCKVNQAETDAIAAELAGRGLSSVDEAGAPVVVINTCTVTGEADHKARKAVRHALALPGRPMVVVTGCLAAIDPEGVSALGDRVIVVPDKERVADVVAARLGPSAGIPRVPVKSFGSSRVRAQVKVQDGCDTLCAYCIVPYARGGPRSVPADRVLEQVSALVEAGVAEVVLTGINIGRYVDAGTDLAALVERVGATGVRRLRLSSIEPGDVTERLLTVAHETPAFCRHLHIPLQSGSDRTLALMGRPYDTTHYAGVLRRARKALPDVAVTTDIIVGHPGETARDDLVSRTFVEQSGFARLHVFRYSARAGTPAAGMTDQVSPEIRAERSAAMRATGERLAAATAARAVGTTVEVLVERVERLGTGVHVTGTTREYLRLSAVAASARVGDVLAVEVTGAPGDGTVEGRVLA